MEKESVTLSARELKKYEIINKTLEGKLTIKQASEELKITPRQVKRLKIKVRDGGVEGLAHKNRGRQPNNKFSVEYIEHAMELIKELYHDFKPTFRRREATGKSRD